MNCPFFEISQPANYLSLIFILILFGIMDFAFWFFFRRLVGKIVLYSTQAAAFLLWGFGLSAPAILCFVGLGIETIILFLANPNENRDLISNNMTGKATKFKWYKRQKNGPEALFDRDAVYRKVETAVISMSKKKVGAIITFEKKDSLDEVMKSGTRIDAPVSAELLETIFYPGTRLHDGAVIIRNDSIVAASVYYTPTTRPLTGKFGSRHRAAIGISEITDSVTVVVSEETGRISIAHEGELRTVGPDEFLSTFEDYMALVESPHEKKEENDN
ncbi:MAG TPA: hypothetical protein DEA63_05060 [Firmicutes bacterium]|nr:hypothetical protein [Bacillota bacterium]